MPDLRPTSIPRHTEDAVRRDIEGACSLIPPAWDLRNFVAVNPFLGFSGRPFDTAARRLADGLGANALPSVDHYRMRWHRGDFARRDVEAAAARHGLDADVLLGVLDGTASPPERRRVVFMTFAERADRERGTDWHGMCIRSSARWCAVHSSRGGLWDVPAGVSLFASWREAARHDRSFDLSGLAGFRQTVSRIPEDPSEAIARELAALDVTARERPDYLYRLLGGLYGWAAAFRRKAWERDPADVGMVRDILAMRICMDSAVARIAPSDRGRGAGLPALPVEDETFRLALHEALEDGVGRKYLRRLRSGRGRPECRPAAQAVFCIDVRSEVLRRHLEAQSMLVETLGFAGFFGVPFRWEATADGPRCPVLLKPAFSLGASSAQGALQAAMPRLQSAPASAFAFVETLGLGFAAKLAASMAAWKPGGGHRLEEFAQIDLDAASNGAGLGIPDRTRMAAAMLAGMGFADRFARLVVLCGHAGRSCNNSHAASLDCGACGGHGGALNARVAVRILNDAEVRAGLREQGLAVPADTVFVAAVHDTSTDEVRILDPESVPPAHRTELEDLRAHFERAAQGTRAERSASLGLQGMPADRLERALRRRSNDWSEVRPEWALAGNAFFLAARRSRSRQCDLESRSFLHEYDWRQDRDGSILRQILSAPVVVASWINLQYLASTVDNAMFGAGDKALHNRVGDVGVVLGNGGDLRTGLPLQSVQGADGTWRHDPLRLQVVVEAPREQLTSALEAVPEVEELFRNGWVRLLRLDPDGDALERFVPGWGWESV